MRGRERKSIVSNVPDSWGSLITVRLERRGGRTRWRRRGWRLTWLHTHTHARALSPTHILLHTFFHRPPVTLSPSSIQLFHMRDEQFSQNVKIGLNKNDKRKSKGINMHTIAHAHAGGPSCLWATDTNKGRWRFDSTRQAATAQQGRPFTACQPAPLQEAPTKKCRMWDSDKRDDGDTVTSNLRHAGMHKKTDTHTYTSLSSSLLPSSSLFAAGQQLACPIVSHTDETAQLCPNSVSSLLPEPPQTLSFQFESTQRTVFLWYQSTFRLQQITKTT